MSLPWIRGNARFDRALDWRPGTAPQDTDRDALNGDGWWQSGWFLSAAWLGFSVVVIAVVWR